MSRRYKAKLRVHKEDHVYGSILVTITVKQLMRSGNKTSAYKLLYTSLRSVKLKKPRKNPLFVFEHAMRRTTPAFQLKSRRVGGATYQVPITIRPRRRIATAIRWLLLAARTRPGNKIAECLAAEILAAAQGHGIAVRKREEVHRIAKANKAYARYRFLILFIGFSYYDIYRMKFHTTLKLV